MRKLFKQITAVAMSATMIIGAAGVTSAAVAQGTNVSQNEWTSYSLHTREDNGEWEDKLIKDGQSYMNTANALKSYGENASLTAKTASSFTMNVVSTGWSANWNPFTGKVTQSNPWGVTATQIMNVERGRYYNLSFKIKSTLSNELTKTVERADGTAYNEGTGKYNYIKHVHFKVFDNNDKDGAALDLTNLTATIGGTSVLTTGNANINKDFSSFIALDSKNTADDGWVTVTASFMIPSLKSEYQSGVKNPTVGVKFAFGAFLREYEDENNMSGTIEVKDFSVVADIMSPSQVKVTKVTPKKKAMVVKFKKSSGAKKYEVQYSLKKNMKAAKVKTTKKTAITIKKLKAKKTYYVRVRGYFENNGKKIYSPYSAKKKVTIK